MGYRAYFLSASKRPDRLIKSVPEAAAPSGSYTEKYFESLIHN